MHDTNVWHEFIGEGDGYGAHHHGLDPRAYVPIFGSTLENYLAEYGEIGFPWATSVNEEHEGYVWLYTAMRPGEVIFNNGGQLPVDEIHFVRHALIQVHTTGDMHHMRKRFHSHYGFFLVENRYTGVQGVVATGGWADYGIMHTPYKNFHCVLPSDPPGFTNINQPPYRSSQTSYRKPGELVHFWSGLKPNAFVARFFPEGPQNILGVAWNTLDAKEYPGAVCGDENFDKPAVVDGNRKFQIFTVALQNLPQSPFSGWTNRYGHIVEGTGTPGIDQVPLTVTTGVPQGLAMLNRPVKHGDEAAAPIIEIPIGDGKLTSI